jgi:hypothetical protein
LFQGASPAEPVATQQEEVERVKRQVQAKVQATPDKKAQIYLYAKVLLPLAPDNFQRERMLAYQTHLRDAKSQEELRKQFEQAYQRAKQKPEDKLARVKPFDEAFADALAAELIEPAGPLAEAFLKAAGADGAKPFEKAFDESLDAQLADLQGQFEQAFQEAQARPGGKGVAPAQRRRAIASVLFTVAEALSEQPPQAVPANESVLTTNPVYKRFIAVVGLRSAVGAVRDQAQTLTDVAEYAAGGLDLERKRERVVFALANQKLVEQARERAAQLESEQAQLERRKKQLAAHDEELKKRRQDVKSYEKELADLRAETRKQMALLRDMSAELHKERVKLRNATKGNQELELKIRELEEGR